MFVKFWPSLRQNLSLAFHFAYRFCGLIIRRIFVESNQFNLQGVPKKCPPIQINHLLLNARCYTSGSLK